MSRGRLIVLEGLDGSGKATQAKRLAEALAQQGLAVREITFPNYASDSSALVRMYLGGQFGQKPDDVNAYAASSFYAVDRYASFKSDWGKEYSEDCIIVADRYTTSNGVHQCSKLPSDEWDSFMNWLYDFEYTKMGLPAPDKVFLLDVPLAVTERLMADRTGKTGGQTGDIHEKNEGFLAKCHAAYDELAERYHWQRIACTKDGAMRTPEAIHQDLYRFLFTL